MRSLARHDLGNGEVERTASYNAHMHTVGAQLFMFLVACGFSFVGWLLAHRRQTPADRTPLAHRINRLSLRVLRALGWVAAGWFGLVAVYYLVMTLIGLFTAKIG